VSLVSPERTSPVFIASFVFVFVPILI